jgi:hypothetical protein
VGLTEALGERGDRLVEGRAPAEHGLERGHAPEGIGLRGEHAPQPVGRRAQHDGAVLEKAGALAPLRAADQLAPVHLELV